MLILFYELFHISSTKGKNFIFEWLLELMEHSSKWLYFPPWFSPVWAISCLFVLFGIEKILCHNICTYWFNFEFLFLIFFYELFHISQIRICSDPHFCLKVSSLGVRLVCSLNNFLAMIRNCVYLHWTDQFSLKNCQDWCNKVYICSYHPDRFKSVKIENCNIFWQIQSISFLNKVLS